MKNYDLEKGYIKTEQRIIKHHEGKPENERKVIADYPYDECETVETYIPFTQTELAQREIAKLKDNLTKTDYQAIKFAEGLLTASEYEPIKEQRQDWRNEINKLEVRAKEIIGEQNENL